MDSIVIHFARPHDLTAALRSLGAYKTSVGSWTVESDDAAVYASPYPPAHFEAECEPAERRAVEGKLGRVPQLSVVVDISGRRGSEQLCAAVVLALLDLGTAVVHDDHGGLCTAQEFRSSAERFPGAGVQEIINRASVG